MTGSRTGTSLGPGPKTFSDGQSVSVTDNLCMSQKIFVYQRQSVYIKDSLCLSRTVCVCDRQSVSVTDNLCLLKSVCFCHIQYLFITDNIFWSRTVWVFHSDCLSQEVCVCHCLHNNNNVILIQGCSWRVFWPDTWFLSKFVRDIWVCLQRCWRRWQLCGPLHTA